MRGEMVLETPAWDIFERRPQSDNLVKFPETLTNGRVPVLENQGNPEKTPVWFIFNGMGSQWTGMGKDLLKFDVCKTSILNSAQVIEKTGGTMNLIHMLENGSIETFQNVQNTIVVIASIQIALVDLLRSVGVYPDGIVGHSLGELAAAYADDGLTAEQVILVAYAIGQSLLENLEPGKGAMAAVGVSWSEAEEKCPSGIYPACHNSRDSVTLSGPAEKIHEFVKELQSSRVFAKEVDSCGLAFHSKYLEPARLQCKKSLDKIIPAPGLRRSNRWISSSVAEDQWESELATTSSSDYFVNNLLSPVLFQEAVQKIPNFSTVVEIGPYPVLQSILKRSLPTCRHIALLTNVKGDNSGFLCRALDTLVNATGVTPKSLTRNLPHPVTAKTSMSPPNPLSKELVESVARILEISPTELENDPKRSFESFGLDSFRAAELQQTIEVVCGRFLSNFQVRRLTFEKIASLKDRMELWQEDEEFHSLKNNPDLVQQENYPNPKETLSYTCAERISKRNAVPLSETISWTLWYPLLLSHFVLSTVFLAPFFKCVRFFIHQYLQFFGDLGQIELMDNWTDPIHVLLKINPVLIMTFSGVPDRPKIIEYLQEHLINFRTNVCLEQGSDDRHHDRGTEGSEEFYQPYERLQWTIKKGPLFYFWKKDPDFNLDRHVLLEQISVRNIETPHQVLDQRRSALFKHYHNFEWDDHSDGQSLSRSRPWWEMKIVQPVDYDPTIPDDQKQFLFVLTWDHSYGDGLSFARLVQYALGNQPSVQVPKETNKPTKISRRSANELWSHSFKIGRVTHFLSQLKDSLSQMHHFISYLAQDMINCRKAQNQGGVSFPTAAIHPHKMSSSASRRFDLSRLKSTSIRLAKVPGEIVSVNAIVLTIAARALTRIYKDHKAAPKKLTQYSCFPLSHFLATVTWAPFKRRRLSLRNNSIITNTVVPLEDDCDSGRGNTRDKFNALSITQQNLAMCGRTQVLHGGKRFSYKALLLPNSLLRVFLSFRSYTSFAFTNTLMPLSRTTTYLGNHRLVDVFLETKGCPLTLTSITDSLGDSFFLTVNHDQTIADGVSPNFSQIFVNYFKEELDKLST